MYRNCDGIEFLRSLPDNSIDGIFTDPPWGRGPEIVGQDNWKALIGDMTRECKRILRPGGRVLVWVGMRMLSDAIKAVRGLEYKWTIFCYYIPPRYLACFEASMDPILFFSRRREKYPVRPKRIRQIYQKVSAGRSDTMHPCARPFKTVKEILNDWFSEGEYVIDPFAGSDTTGQACRELDLRYESCEIDPLMFEIGKKRDAQMRLSI